MTKFASIDTIMEPAQISHTMSQSQDQPSIGDPKREMMNSITGVQSPSWSGVRSLLGDKGRKDRSREEGPLYSQGENESIPPSSVDFSPSSLTSSSTVEKSAGDKSKTVRKPKAKEPKSYKSSI